MKSTKVWQLAETLSLEERNRFKKYLLSPYFNADQRLVLFWDWMDRVRGEEQALKADVFNVLWPDESYKDAKVRHYCSYLYKQLLGFLGQEQLKERPFDKEWLILSGLAFPDRDHFFEQQQKKVARQLLGSAQKDQEHFLNRWRLQTLVAARSQQKTNRDTDQDLVEADATLDQLFVLSKLRNACSFINNRQVLKGESGGIHLEMIPKDNGLALQLRAEVGGPEGIPLAIQVYEGVYRSLSQPNDEFHYHHLIRILPEAAETFSAAELRSLYTFAQNYCIRKINLGRENYLEELFQLYVRMIDKGLLLEQGVLSPWHYKNITVTALRTERADWAAIFLEQFRERIPEAFRANAYTYNKAKLHFYQKEYSEVLKLLQKVEYEDLFYSLDSKAMLLKTYYESGEWAALESMMESFSQYLRRKKTVPEQHKRNYLNLIRFVKKMGEAPSLQGWQSLKEELKTSANLADREWVLQMIERGEEKTF